MARSGVVLLVAGVVLLPLALWLVTLGEPNYFLAVENAGLTYTMLGFPVLLLYAGALLVLYKSPTLSDDSITYRPGSFFPITRDRVVPWERVKEINYWRFREAIGMSIRMKDGTNHSLRLGNESRVSEAILERFAEKWGFRLVLRDAPA